MVEVVEGIRMLLDLGTPAIYLVIIFVLWREYRNVINEMIEILKRYRDEENQNK